jgi:hypothetical protein
MAETAANVNAMNKFRDTGECAEKPEQNQCKGFGGLRRVSRRVRLGLIIE